MVFVYPLRYLIHALVAYDVCPDRQSYVGNNDTVKRGEYRRVVGRSQECKSGSGRMRNDRSKTIY